MAALHEFPYQALLTEDPSNKLICSAALSECFKLDKRLNE